MLTNNSANGALDELLDLIGASTQLTDTQRESADRSYHAIGEWLDDPASPIRQYKPVIFPQGSLALDTSNKPLRTTQFDLDAVCHLQVVNEKMVSPAAVYDFVFRRMQAHATYAKMIEKKPRCIRVNYDGDFHLDIVPAVTDSRCPQGESCIYIPDRELLTWRPSNPRGYIAWFEDQCRRRLLVEKYAELSRHKRANVTPLPDPAPLYLKQPLKISVQLLKRWRDIEFQGRMQLSPSSIVLTTLAGTYYRGEPHPTDALASILFAIGIRAQEGPIRLRNPSNPKEWVTDRWADTDEAQKAFAQAILKLQAQWQSLLLCHDYIEMVEKLKDLFQDTPVNNAVKKAAAKRVAAQRNGFLYMTKSNGNLGIASTPGIVDGGIKSKRHNFHGAH